MNSYVRKSGELETSFNFVRSEELPTGVPISAALTIPFILSEVVLVQKGNGWWDIVGGKLEDGEGWEEAATREAEEEAGVVVDQHRLIGYVHVKNNVEQPAPNGIVYPLESVMPVSISMVRQVRENSEFSGDLKRSSFKSKEVASLLEGRGDNAQLLDIVQTACSVFAEMQFAYTFTFVPGAKASEGFMHAPVTQVMAFLINKKKEFIIVRDQNESFYSLPGGGCELGESSEAAMLREIQEEAQIVPEQMELLGTIEIQGVGARNTLQRVRQLRFIGSAEESANFIPMKDGFEVEEVRCVPFDQMTELVKSLKNQTGQSILEYLKEKI